MITRILIGLLAAAAIAIVVLAILLHRANGQVADMERTIATRDAMAEEAMRSADALIASYEKERESRKALDDENAMLHAMLDSLQTRRHAPPRPPSRTAAERRASILRAARQ